MPIVSLPAVWRVRFAFAQASGVGAGVADGTAVGAALDGEAVGVAAVAQPAATRTRPASAARNVSFIGDPPLTRTRRV